MTSSGFLKLLKSFKQLLPRRPKGWMAVLAAMLVLSIFAVEFYQSDSSSNQDASSQAKTNPGQLYPVVKVADGDTITIMVGDAHVPLRLIGVDTPESVDPRRPVECFGQEAAQFTRQHLEGKQVYVMADPTQQDVDVYGRLLRYVTLEDGRDFNALLISEGYAHEYTFRVPYENQKLYQQLELQAQNTQRGLWHPNNCPQ